jgi:hypothetical protein
MINMDIVLKSAEETIDQMYAQYGRLSLEILGTSDEIRLVSLGVSFISLNERFGKMLDIIHDMKKLCIEINHPYQGIWDALQDLVFMGYWDGLGVIANGFQE